MYKCRPQEMDCKAFYGANSIRGGKEPTSSLAQFIRSVQSLTGNYFLLNNCCLTIFSETNPESSRWKVILG